MKDGIYPELGMSEYLAAKAASSSKMWTLHTKTAAHVAESDDKSSADQDYGTAVHTAVLEPHKFGSYVVRGPADRRGNKWKHAVAEHPNSLVLPAPAYEKVCRLRDSVMRNPTIAALGSELAQCEYSGFWTDFETGITCKCRPDLYRPDYRLMVDLKTTTDVTREFWLRACMSLGYHAKDAWYSDGWPQAGGGEVENFLFVVIEREPPFAHAIYELGPAERDLGRRICRKSLQKYAECETKNEWPGFSSEVQPMTFPEWQFSDASFKGVYND